MNLNLIFKLNITLRNKIRDLDEISRKNKIKIRF